MQYLRRQSWQSLGEIDAGVRIGNFKMSIQSAGASSFHPTNVFPILLWFALEVQVSVVNAKSQCSLKI
jgi:hypothetical protein